MQVRRFYLPTLTATSAAVDLPEGESQHALRVLRLQAGDELLLLNGQGLVARAELLPAPAGVRRPKQASCRIMDVQVFPRTEYPLELCVAPPRGKAFDLVLKAAVELGYLRIQPILCRYGVARPDEASEGWRETLVSALKQSCNPWLPELCAPREFATVLAEGVPGIFGASPAAEATARQPLSIPSARQVRRLWVGPEGGFAPDEESALLSAGVTPVTLSSATLRVETAVPALTGFLWGRCGAEEGCS